MKVLDMLRSMKRTGNRIKRDINFRKLCHQHIEYERALKANARFSGIHKGERCFILGNGPSLKEENLKLLENEYVFTVNQVSRHADFKWIKPNYHFWADPNFFVIDKNKPEDMELLEVMKSVKTEENSPECFFPITQYEFVKEYNIDGVLNTNFYLSNFEFDEFYKKDVDFTKPTPAFYTVVQWCVLMAVYMGFSKIYLLGCDNTSLLVNMKSVLEVNDDSDYGYSLSENEKKRMTAMVKRQSLEAQIRSALNTFNGYRLLYEYCTKREIQLINCSSTTLIDSIPRKKFTEVIGDNRR